MINLYIFDDAKLVSAAQNASIVEVAPCLARVTSAVRTAGVKAKSCNTCGGRRAAAKAASSTTDTLSAAKRCIVALPWPMKNRLKALLNAKSIRIFVPRETGRVDKITF